MMVMKGDVRYRDDEISRMTSEMDDIRDGNHREIGKLSQLLDDTKSQLSYSTMERNKLQEEQALLKVTFPFLFCFIIYHFCHIIHHAMHRISLIDSVML
jgi:hypothetical protein